MIWKRAWGGKMAGMEGGAGARRLGEAVEGAHDGVKEGAADLEAGLGRGGRAAGRHNGGGELMLFPSTPHTPVLATHPHLALVHHVDHGVGRQRAQCSAALRLVGRATGSGTLTPSLAPSGRLLLLVLGAAHGGQHIIAVPQKEAAGLVSEIILFELAGTFIFI